MASRYALWYIAVLTCASSLGCGLGERVRDYGPDRTSDTGADPVIASDASVVAATSFMDVAVADTARMDASASLDGTLADAAACPSFSSDADASVEMTEIERNFVSALPGRPVTIRWRAGHATKGLPLVVIYHGDMDDGSAYTASDVRAALSLEAVAAGRAVFAYPEQTGGAWQHYTFEGRAREVQFLLDVVTALQSELAIDRQHVYLVGWGGGAIIANTIACTAGYGQLSAVAVHSGTLYPLENPNGAPGMDHDFKLDFPDMIDYAAPRCDPPPMMVLWGDQDVSDGTSYVDGLTTVEAYREQLNCSYEHTAWDGEASCEVYTSCTRNLVSCAVDGLQHQIWDGAADAIWQFFEASMYPGCTSVDR